METVIWLTAGAVLGAGFMRLAAAAGRERLWRVTARGVVVAALIYVVIALAGGAGPAWLGVEVLGVLFFGGLVVADHRRSLLSPALGWMLHAVWDGAHLPSALDGVPDAYALLCLGFDPVVAGWLVGRWWSERGGAVGSRREMGELL